MAETTHWRRRVPGSNLRRKTLLALLAAGASVCPGHLQTAQAAVIFDNTAGASAGADLISGTGPLAQSFTTGSSAVSLADLALVLSAVQPGDSGSLVVTLMSNGGNGPGAQADAIGSIADSALSATLASYDLELSSPFLLAANTEYWIEIAGTASSAQWSYSMASGTGVTGAYTYNNYNDNNAPGIADITAGGLYQMCLSNTQQACAVQLASSGGSGSSGPTAPGITTPPSAPLTPAPPQPPSLSNPAVPEPAALGLLATGLALLAVARRSRRGGTSVCPV